MPATATSTSTTTIPEHTCAIDTGLVVTFSFTRRGRLAERWTPRRPAQLSPAEARRYEAAAAQARTVLQVVAT